MAVKLYFLHYVFSFDNIILEILFQAYEICVSRDLLREQVFILGRMGNPKQALAVIVNKLGDIEEVYSFVLGFYPGFFF